MMEERETLEANLREAECSRESLGKQLGKTEDQLQVLSQVLILSSSVDMVRGSSCQLAPTTL